MKKRRTSLADALRRRLTSPQMAERLERLGYDDRGHGYDPFGAHRDWVGAVTGGADFLYERWFRVVSEGVQQIPAEGPVLLIANHSGTLPFDAAMLCCDVLRKLEPPRLPRVVADRFVPNLPWVGLMFARAGVVGGDRRNVEALLRAGELVVVFPEGAPGIGKSFRDRYQLQEWREGHAELALRYGAKIVPVGIVGPEEQMPVVARVERFSAFGAPYLPIPVTPIPLPVRYHIRYGAPIDLSEQWSPEDSDRPEVTRAAAARTKLAVQGLVDRGLAEREGVFR